MAEPLVIAATVLGVVATAVSIAGQLWPRSPASLPPAQRDATPPPPPGRSPTIPDAELDALRARVTVLERLEEKSRDAREAMGNTLTKILTILEMRAASRAAKEKARDSE